MSSRSLLILTALVVALGAFIWFFERHQPGTAERAEMADKVFPGLTAESIDTFEIRNAHGAFSFERRDDRWAMTSPLATDADDTAVSGALSAVLDLDKERTLTLDEVDPSAYRLETPEFTVVMIEDDGESHRLEIGDETALGAKRAVSIGDGNVILTSSWVTSSLDKAIEDWRSRDLCSVHLDELSAIQVEHGAERVEAVRRSDRWRLESPVEDLADEDHLRGLVTSLSALRIDDFTEGEANPGDFGTGSPRYLVRLLGTDGKTAVQLAFGDTRPEENGVTVACLRNTSDLFWVDDGAEQVLAKAPVLWRDPNVVTFDTWNVDQLVISGPDGEVSLDRATGDWLFTDGSEADSEAVRNRLAALRGLQALEHDLVHLGTPELGRVRIFGAGPDDEPTELVFFESMSDGGHALAEVTGRSNIMGVDADEVERILGDLEALRADEQAGESEGND